MKMVKKLLAVTLAGVLALSVLTGCSKDSTSTSFAAALQSALGSGTVTYSNAQDLALDAAIKAGDDAVKAALKENFADSDKENHPMYKENTETHKWELKEDTEIDKALTEGKQVVFLKAFLSKQVGTQSAETVEALLKSNQKTVLRTNYDIAKNKNNRFDVKGAVKVADAIAYDVKHNIAYKPTAAQVSATSGTYKDAKYTYVEAEIKDKAVTAVVSNVKVPSYMKDVLGSNYLVFLMVGAQ